MLQLQRASAGSGKTYTLAKKFIEYYISEPIGNGKRRLRPVKELREALQSILAITFTNKATNEMKLRIVAKLNALANWTPAIPLVKTDYLNDFIKEFGCSGQEIAAHCKYALKVLLTDYSDFKVSTIDSFFQGVLRTFAYEADLDDTYQLELDSNYVIQMGLDTTLDEIETEDESTQGTVWIGSMMENKASSGKGWNIFQKKGNKQSVYGEILNASRNLAKEDFKEIRERLDNYFNQHPDFYSTYHKLCKIYEKDVRETHVRMKQAARALGDAFADAGLDIAQHGGQYLASRVKNMAETWDWDSKPGSFKIPEFNRKGSRTRVFNPSIDNPYLNTPTEDKLEDLAIRMYECFEAWQNEANSEKIKRWKIYRSTMPYVGLLQSVRNNSKLFLTDTNTVELSETNSILSRIIGDDDAPFVYERLGSKLEHFLIDEFQDTSSLQWHILRPLLIESEGKGFENLIIGDAKQSIYRFRNANPSLITTKVPEEFSNSCIPCGNTPQENTNWRSSMKVVKFNNLFFRFFSKELGDHMEKLYFNAIQPASHKENRGYVKVQLFKNEKGEDNLPAHFAEIPELISDMLKRGYRMNEIAVLVDTHEQGTQIIDSIMLYNQREDATEKINFISSDSLETGESPAVQTVISILEAINNGTHAELRPIEERNKKGVGDWSKLRADFSLFEMQNAGKPLSEILSRFISGEFNPDSIRDIMGKMSTSALPALIENIIKEFVPEKMRSSDAAFLGALQDLTLEFSERTTSDISSFLDWWNKKGRYKSISSPEGSNAVNIMTVHKSKGLEFRCVIVPFSKQTIQPPPNQKEWLWVMPDLSEAEQIPQIPWIPVWSDPRLDETIHAATYQKYLQNYLIDKVNMAYVAYTRAIDELYIFTPCEIKEDGSLGDTKRIGAYLWRCGTEAKDIIEDLRLKYPEAESYLPTAEEIEVDAENKCWSYGEQLSKEDIEKGRKEKKDSERKETTAITDYRSTNTFRQLLCSDTTGTDRDTLPTNLREESDDIEPEEIRLYGEIMHSVMETITTADDLHISLLRMKSSGHIGLETMTRLERELGAAIENVKEYGWFEKGMRVITERSIVGIGDKVQRPDRIVIRPDKTAVVVDYKFGTQRNDKKYLRQVRKYANAIEKAGIASKCEGYVWYVTLGTVLK